MNNLSDITLKNISFTYKDKKIFEDFSVSFERQKITVILGKSGIGKTTLLNIIANNIKERFAYIFQEHRLLENISVEKNISLPLKNFYAKEQIKKRSDYFLKKVSLFEKKAQLTKYLSGGEKQRVSIARAFAFGTNLILMDEPFQSQDIKQKTEMMKLICKLNETEMKTIIFVTHDIQETLCLADRIIVIKENPCKIKFDRCINHKTNKIDLCSQIYNFKDEYITMQNEILKILNE